MFDSYLQNCSYFNPLTSMGTLPQNMNVEFQFSQSTCEIVGTSTLPVATTSTTTTAIPVYFENTEISSSSDIALASHITAGELAIIMLLLLMFITYISIAIVQALSRITTSRTYLQYQGGDVEIRKDL